jgi:hypothetical protein
VAKLPDRSVGQTRDRGWIRQIGAVRPDAEARSGQLQSRLFKRNAFDVRQHHAHSAPAKMLGER